MGTDLTMSSYSRVFIVISVLYILTFFSPVFSQNCVLVGEKFNLTFSYNSPQTAVFWLKNGAIFFTAAVENSGSGCQGGGNSVAGFTFYCEDGGTTYIMEITSKLSDKDVTFTTNPKVESLDYTPITDLTGTNTNLDQCPKRLCDCNQPEEKVENNSTFSCELTCTQYKDLILQYQPESGPVQDLENNVNSTMVKCNNYADLENSTFDYIIDSNHAVLRQFNSKSNKVRLIVKMVFEGRSETVFETSYFYFASSGNMTSVEPTTTQTSSSRMSSEPQTSSLSSPSSSLSSSPSGQDGGGSSSTETSPTSVPLTTPEPTAITPTPTPSTVTTPKPTDTEPTTTTTTPSPLTTTELIIVVVCSCVGFLLLVVLVVCCVILSIRRKNRKHRPPGNKPYGDNSMIRYPYHHSSSSPKTKTQTTSSSKPGSRQPSSSERPELQYTNYGYYNRPDDRHIYRDYDNNLRQYRNYNNNLRQYRNYDNVYNNHRPSRRDDNRRHREDINMTPYRLYYQPHQYHYL